MGEVHRLGRGNDFSSQQQQRRTLKNYLDMSKSLNGDAGLIREMLNAEKRQPASSRLAMLARNNVDMSRSLDLECKGRRRVTIVDEKQAMAVAAALARSKNTVIPFWSSNGHMVNQRRQNSENAAPCSRVPAKGCHQSGHPPTVPVTSRPESTVLAGSPRVAPGKTRLMPDRPAQKVAAERPAPGIVIERAKASVPQKGNARLDVRKSNDNNCEGSNAKNCPVEEKQAVISSAVSKPVVANLKMKSVDMASPMQNHAIQCAQEAIESNDSSKLNYKRVASHIKKDFDKVYGPAWHCIVGTSFGSYVTHSIGGFIYFSIGKVSVLLFKTSIEVV